MATESKDVELRVRARDYSQKTLDAVTQALEDLTKAQDEQLASAKKGEATAKDMAKSYEQIENAVKALISQSALTKTFDANAAALERSKNAANAARDAQTAYAQSLVGTEKVTAKQIATQTKLDNAVAKADKSQLASQTRLDRTVAKLGEYGIAAGDVAAAQQRMIVGVNAGNAALEKQAKALDTIDAELAKYAADEAKVAAMKAKWAAEDVAASKRMADAAKDSEQARLRGLQLQNSVAKANADAAKAEAAMLASMRASADQALANARGYDTLARSVKSVAGNDLAQQLRAISDPAGEAMKTIDGIDKSLGGLTAKIAAINGPIKDFKTTLQGLEAVQSSAAGIAKQVDGYRNQAAAVKEAKTAYAQAQQTLNALMITMRAGGGDAAELGKQLAAAESNVKKTAAAFGQQGAALADMEASLKKAGVDVNELDAAEARLVEQTKKSTAAITTLNEAFNKHGVAVEKAAKSQFKFFDGTRTTLSWSQRLRGEIIAMTAAYVGLNGVLDVAKSALDTFGTAQKIEGQLGAAFGNDAGEIKRQWDYLLDASNRIGISFREAAPAYAKFAIAAKSFGFNGKDIRDVFEGLAKASVKAGLSASDFEGVLKAVEQMLSKGTIQAEELRGQLGDRLPGAFVLMAQSMNITTAELTKLMEATGVGAEALLPFADKVAEKFGTASDATVRLTKAQAEYNNALFVFQQAIANSGFADAFTKLLTDLAKFLNDNDGKELAKQIGEGFSAVVDILRYLIKNIDEVKLAFAALTGLLVFKWAMSAVAGFTALAGILAETWTVAKGLFAAFGTAAVVVEGVGAASAGAAIGVGVLGTAFRLLLGPIGAVILGIEAAIWAYKKLTKASSDAQAANADLTNRSKSGKILDADGNPTLATFGPAPKADGPSARNMGDQRAMEALAKEREKDQKKLDRDRKSAMKKSAKDELDERSDLIKEEFNGKRDAAKAAVKDAKLQSEAILAIDKQEKQALETDRIRFDAEHAKAGAAAANKEITLAETVKNGLLKIRDDLAAAETKADQGSSFEDRKATRLAAISHAYDKLKKDISKLSVLDKDGAADASKKLDAYIGQLQALESVKVTVEEVKKLEKELTDVTSIRDNQLKEQKDLYDAGLITQEAFLANTAEVEHRGQSAITQAADNLQGFVDAAVKAKAGILSLTEQADIKAKTTGAKAGAAGATNRIQDAANAAQSQAIDALVAKRDAAETNLRKQLELRMIGEDEYAAKSNANADLYKGKILEITNALIAELEAQRALGILEGTLTPERLAALDAQIAKQQLLATTTANTAKQLTTLQQTAAQALGGALETSLNGVVTALTNIATGAKSTGDAFKDMAVTALGALRDMINQILMAIAKQLILNALASSGGVVGQIAGAAGGVATKHSGGMVGAGISGTVRKGVSSSWFEGAPRYHDGGVVGLKPGEVPAILQTGEQVLSRDDPRNVLNGKPATGGGNPAGTRVVLVDDRSKVPEAMRSAEGEDVIIQTIRRNAAAIKQYVR